MPDERSERELPAATVGGARDAEPEAFDAWASRQRRRATRDGAWRVECSERVLRGAVTRTVCTWHDRPQKQRQPSRPAQPRRDMPKMRRQQQPERQQQQSHTQPNSKQRRSALRSAARHQKIARRVRCAVLAVRFVQRLRRMQVKQVKPAVTTLVPRDVSSPKSPSSPSKRKLEAVSADSPTRSSTHAQVAAILFAGSATELRSSYVSAGDDGVTALSPAKRATQDLTQAEMNAEAMRRYMQRKAQLQGGGSLGQ